MSKVLVPIANGSEEIEAVTVIDTLRRAGAEVTVASVNELQIKASRGVNIVADQLIADCVDQDWDLVVIPGGMPGAANIRDSVEVTTILRRQFEQGRPYAAICAGPVVVLQHHGLLAGLSATAHPGFADQLPDQSIVKNRVVVDGRVVTSRGPGTALEFALTLVEMLFGRETAEQVAAPMLPAGWN